MTAAEITKRQERESRKFEVAKQIRELLDKARKEYGADEWDGRDLETEVIELVTGE